VLQPCLQPKAAGPPVQTQLGFEVRHRHGVVAAGWLAGGMDEVVGSAAASGGQERHRTGRAQVPLATLHPRPIARRLPWTQGRAPAVFRYEVYVRIVVDDPAPLTGAEAVLTAARPRGCGAD